MFAIWSDNKLSEEQNRLQYNKVEEYYKREILPYKSESFVPHLAVEGGALLAGDIKMLDTLKSDGVQMLTLVWKDVCCIGGGHNTNIGLTPFGKDVVKKMCEVGIVPDISHASDKMAYEVFEIADSYGKAVCASHSNLRSVYNHTRNMTDDMFLSIISLGGLAGVNFYPHHLTDTDTRKADITAILRHVEKYLELGGQKNICLGCDFDGIEITPEDITGADKHYLLCNEMKKIGYSEELIEDLFFNNAHNFFVKQ